MSKKLGILTGTAQRIARIATAIIRELVTPDEVSVSEDTEKEKAKAEVKALIAAKREHFANVTAVVARGVTREDFTTDMLRAITGDVQPPHHRTNDDSYHPYIRRALPPDGSDELTGLYLRYCTGDQSDLLGRLRHDAMTAFARADMEARRTNGQAAPPAD